MRFGLVMLVVALSLPSFGRSLFQQNEKLVKCLEYCQSLIGEPAYVVKNCVLSCQAQFGKPKKPLFCETYEEDCTRPGTGDENDDGEGYPDERDPNEDPENPPVP